MKLAQLKPWLKSVPKKIPLCVLSCYAGNSHYLMEVEYKHQLQPLTDSNNNLIYFKTIEQAQNVLKKIGINHLTLRLIDPYDEFSDNGLLCDCDQDMVLAF
ncbi:lysyl-tRNA synthetase [Photobacterium kishitanii]|uniref:Lysyl-tRNA synthetase n=1 Tax=Photobacterium kishitanii TaxID=318456 RepID=A0AAX0YRS7_9GAMM|nr:DUF6482 family protein [Photobacterium kishitanii]KJG09873.1 lysyl-tRNA synthetase [Photobacterium kishitanii]KJG58472.1 lysyl-tRNA synthetase [Photobacterium kishitanii]KJG61759.1 lysyl-tRNA synthetase [Photobacterium kishitanii]KJG66489.1 lysyl-tRNA synthetase [Photobacterium kishitanii]KJG70025.1 lysyl-tRNA synthetase [Photobacterium kishitanii]